ncbi:MAG: RluA family pseudouridine synthase [Treponema sp.]|nr:RluA family pseudouridine synthase [Treponema sp.]
MDLQTGGDDAGRRLDRILRKALPEHSLSLIHRLLRQGLVLVNGRAAKPDDRVEAGALITIPLDDINLMRKIHNRRSPLPSLEIIWQGSGLLILNKPAGLAVHGPDSLDTLVQAHLAGTLAPSLSFRPGPLHRLDKPTSGLIAFSATLAGARFFSAMIRERNITKTYLALLEGRIETNEVWQDDLVRDTDAKKTFIAGPDAGAAIGKAALTRIQPLASSSGYTLISAEIDTGRTHQIRAQAAAHGHPLAGDVKYGGHSLISGQDKGKRRGGDFMLHAWKLETSAKITGFGTSELPPLLCAPIPEVFQNRIRELFGADIALYHKLGVS